MTKVFDEEFVDCNDCGHYWEDDCDGLTTDQVKKCTSYFKAQRRFDIPEEIMGLKREVRHLKIRFRVYYCTLLILMVVFQCINL